MTRTLHELTAETEFWECHQTKGDGKTCFKINETEDKYRRCVVISTSRLVTENMNCRGCNTKRDKGDIAIDKYNRTIGMLKKVEGVVEYWEHYELDDGVREGETGVTSGGGS
ncbi:hypothetical protein FOC4_g10005797 [Fusarium odoratissimum]|uniref:Uncharacterized protein n=1 Tax=Fusarium oxysporum f. sp. cubense (strain race 4) TaxID=2502994 RepID=N1RPI3_FUSC4|nr:hypothetical protein FOC4_g10005797 [Fusarium odoratissimum]